MNNLIRVSELFYSIQGEAHYTGTPTVWVRFFGCNLNCDGFGQKEPTKPVTYQLPYKDFDVNSVSTIEELPVWKFGCDSSYSWSAKFKHLQKEYTPEQIYTEICQLITNEYNPYGNFRHKHSGKDIHLCFTGGEPLLKRNQLAVIEILKQCARFGNIPKFITFETNGTQPLIEEFKDFLYELGDYETPEILFSVSPKLFSVSGEKRSKAIKPEAIRTYRTLPTKYKTYFKFVVGNTQEEWDELEEVVDLFKESGIKYPIWIMPTSATVEGQQEIAGEVAQEAMKRGYNVSARVHCYLFGNALGT